MTSAYVDLSSAYGDENHATSVSVCQQRAHVEQQEEEEERQQQWEEQQRPQHPDHSGDSGRACSTLSPRSTAQRVTMSLRTW